MLEEGPLATIRINHLLTSAPVPEQEGSAARHHQPVSHESGMIELTGSVRSCINSALSHDLDREGICGLINHRCNTCGDDARTQSRVQSLTQQLRGHWAAADVASTYHQNVSSWRCAH